MTASNLKNLHLDPRVESMFAELDRKIETLSDKEKVLSEFLGSIANSSWPISEELAKTGCSDDYIHAQFEKGWEYILEKYNHTFETNL